MNETTVDLLADALPSAIEFFRTYISLMESDGTLHIREVTSISDQGGGTIRLGWTGAISGLASMSLAKISWCHKVRFDSDEFVEEWLTNLCDEDDPEGCRGS